MRMERRSPWQFICEAESHLAKDITISLSYSCLFLASQGDNKPCDYQCVVCSAMKIYFPSDRDNILVREIISSPRQRFSQIQILTSRDTFSRVKSSPVLCDESNRVSSIHVAICSNLAIARMQNCLRDYCRNLLMTVMYILIGQVILSQYSYILIEEAKGNSSSGDPFPLKKLGAPPPPPPVFVKLEIEFCSMLLDPYLSPLPQKQLGCCPLHLKRLRLILLYIVKPFQAGSGCNGSLASLEDS